MIEGPLRTNLEQTDFSQIEHGEKIQCFPGNSGLLVSISARMQPTLQISIDFVYPLEFNMISGARYHRVATYSVRMPV